MKTTPKLTPKQEMFAQTYVKTGNASEALRTAYPNSKKWKENSVYSKSSQMLAKVKVRQRVTEIQNQLKDKHLITKEMLLKELKNIITFDIRNIFKDNNLKQVDELDDNTAKVINSVKIRQEKIANESIAEIIEIKTNDKLRAIETANKMLGFNEAEKIITEMHIKGLSDFYDEAR